MRVIISGNKFGANKFIMDKGWSWLHLNKNDLSSINSLCDKLKVNKNGLLNIFQKTNDVFEFNGFFALAVPVLHEFEGELKIDSILILIKNNLVITFCHSLSESIINEVITTTKSKVKKINELFIMRRLLQEAYESAIQLIDKREDVIDRLVEGAAILKIEIDRLVQLILKNRRYLSKIKEVMHDYKRILFDLDEELPPEFEKKIDLKKISQLNAGISEELTILYTLEQKLSEALSLHDLLLTNKMNSIVTKLTVITAIFLAPSFITGLFGMNNLFNPKVILSLGALSINTTHIELSILALTIVLMIYYVYRKNMLRL